MSGCETYVHGEEGMRMEKVKRGFGKLCFILGVLLFGCFFSFVFQPELRIRPSGVVVSLILTSFFMFMAGMGISEHSERLVLFSVIRVGIVGLLYLVLLFQCVFGNYVFARSYGIAGNHFIPFSGNGMTRYNFIPFKTIIEYFSFYYSGEINKNIIMYNVFGNLVLLAPLGFFIPYFFKKCRKLVCIIIAGVVCSLAIEVIQGIFGIGSFDVDDMLLNTIGVCVVYFVWKIPFVECILKKGKIVV